jgi:hypothetical protein
VLKTTPDEHFRTSTHARDRTPIKSFLRCAASFYYSFHSRDRTAASNPTHTII